MAFAAALLAAAALAIPAVRYLRQGPLPSLPETRADINTPATTDPISFALSPDGRQMVFVSSGEGQSLLWLRPLGANRMNPGAMRSMCVRFLDRAGDGGSPHRAGVNPRGGPTGRSCSTWQPDGRLMAATIAAKGPAIEPGIPVAMFQTRLWGGGANATSGPQYDVAPDGRFLMDITAGDSTNSPITLLLNWNPPAK